MLYSIGYQKLKNVGHLIRILKKFDIKHFMDVRSRPYGKRHVFNRKKLESALPKEGIDYLWMGRSLGGFSKIEEYEIDKLAVWQQNKSACLMCMEADPDTCHRKYEIARRLKTHGVEVEHLTI